MGIFDSDQKVAKFLRNLSRYGNLTLKPAAGILLGFFIGRRGDELWETEPLLAIAGVLFGLAIGLFFLYRAAMEDIRRSKNDKKT